MPETSRTTECGSCGGAVDEMPGALESDRQPCPSCGSLQRLVGLVLTSQVTMQSSLQLRGRHSAGRPFVEHFVASDFWRKAGRWVHKVRRIDRESNRYDEVVTYPETGEIIHEAHESLNRHRGHGSDTNRP